MERKIVGFSRDDAGEWIAELECGHRQHVRHNPPWQLREWVVSEDGRNSRLGTVTQCRLCDPAPPTPPMDADGAGPDGRAGRGVSTSAFYDELASWYDLIFADWEASMSRQGAVLAQAIRDASAARGEPLRVLDAAAGIGTQALPLAALGFDVTARDVSPAAIARLRREAGARGVHIDASVADMRTLRTTLDGRFDAVIACDNAIPHLPTETEIAAALRGFFDLLVDGGVLLLSVRDYEQVDRSPTSFHPYGEKTRDGRRFRLGQHWAWLDPLHYRTTFVIEEHDGTAWKDVLRIATEYHAISIGRLLDLMRESGFESCTSSELPYFQPLLVGRRPG